MITKDVGDRVDLRYESRSVDGTLTNATVTLTVTDPSGDTTTPSVTNTATGIYDAAFTLAEAGTWQWKWSATGNVVDVAYGQVTAQDPAPPSYVTVAEVKLALNIPSTNTSHDARLARVIHGASRAVEQYCDQRVFYLARTSTARTYHVTTRGPATPGVVFCTETGYRLYVDDIGHSTFTVETRDSNTDDWTALTEGTDFDTYPDNALAKSRPIEALVSEDVWPSQVRVTARWGWPVPPPQVVEATMLQATRLYRRKDSPEGVMGSSDWGLIRVPNLDPDVRQLLSWLHTEAMIA